MVKKPSALVVVVSVVPRRLLVTVTTAPGIAAPCPSCTVPLREAAVDCARAGAIGIRLQQATRAASHSRAPRWRVGIRDERPDIILLLASQHERRTATVVRDLHVRTR